MRPTSFSFGTADVRLRTGLDRASASNRQSETVIVHVQDADGIVGLGEGCPRKYVTGETMETALGWLHRRRHVLAALNDAQDLANFIMRNSREIDENPSAFCAAELALLDLFARQAEQSMETLFFAPALKGPLTASAVYSEGGYFGFRSQVQTFAKLGMTDAKLEISGKPGQDGSRIRQLAAKGGKVRVDANNLWPNSAAVYRGLQFGIKQVWAVEEPVARGDWGGMKDVVEKTGLSVIVDESFTSQSDLQGIPTGDKFILNFSVSKMGGLMRSVSALRMALDQKRKVIVGAQPGESSILARAGLVIAAGAGDQLIAYEGAYGAHLLQQDLVAPGIQFGQGGKVAPGSLLEQHGLGLKLRAEAKELMRPPVNADYWMPMTESA